MRSTLLLLLLAAACAATTPTDGRNDTATGGKADDGDSSPVGSGTLLDCNTPIGPDQQVTVIGDGTTLTLRELTTSGAQVDRALDLDEWTSDTLRLRDDFGSSTTMAKDSAGWVVRSSGDGIDEVGDADCWVDRSP